MINGGRRCGGGFYFNVDGTFHRWCGLKQIILVSGRNDVRMRDERGGGGRGQMDVDEADSEGGDEKIGRRGAHVGERQR